MLVNDVCFFLTGLQDVTNFLGGENVTFEDDTSAVMPNTVKAYAFLDVLIRNTPCISLQWNWPLKTSYHSLVCTSSKTYQAGSQCLQKANQHQPSSSF